MKVLLTICLLLILAPSIASGQPRRASLTRQQVREAESRLAEMGYWTGTVDGVVDTATQSALIAFQKWEGRALTGKLTIDELEAIRTSAGPKARDGEYEHVEVDIDRQVLLIVDDA
jgi:peptidoglycan hydrolase-like protein with peptidoglycan-binding domain